MASYRIELKNRRLDDISDDIGSGGKLVIGTSGMALVLSTVMLASPAYDPADGGVINLAGVPLVDADAAATGLARSAQVQQSDGTVVIDELTVGVGAGHVQLENDEITQHKEVRVVSGLIQHA